MPLWLTLTVFGMFSVAIADISQRVSLRGQSPLSSITNNFIVWNGIGFLSLIYFLLSGQAVPTIPASFLYQLIPIAILYFLGGSFYYQSFKSNSVSISAVLAMISSVITTGLGIMLYQESANPYKFLGSIIVIFAIILVNFKKGAKLDKYNIYALLGGIFYGFAYTLDKHFVISTSPDFYQMVLCFAVGISSLIFSPKTIITETKLFHRGLIFSILSSIFFFFLYQKFYFLAYTAGGEVGRIDVLNNTTIFIVIFLEFILLKEKNNLNKKIIPAILAVIGVAILALAK
jgi:uncharacterized membrane protein